MQQLTQADTPCAIWSNREPSIPEDLTRVHDLREAYHNKIYWSTILQVYLQFWLQRTVTTDWPNSMIAADYQYQFQHSLKLYGIATDKINIKKATILQYRAYCGLPQLLVCGYEHTEPFGLAPCGGPEQCLCKHTTNRQTEEQKKRYTYTHFTV